MLPDTKPQLSSKSYSVVERLRSPWQLICAHRQLNHLLARRGSTLNLLTWKKWMCSIPNENQMLGRPLAHTRQALLRPEVHVFGVYSG